MTFRFLLWRRANTRNVSFETLYGGQFTLSIQLIMPNQLPYKDLSLWSWYTDLWRHLSATYQVNLTKLKSELHVVYFRAFFRPGTEWEFKKEGINRWGKSKSWVWECLHNEFRLTSQNIFRAVESSENMPRITWIPLSWENNGHLCDIFR